MAIKRNRWSSRHAPNRIERTTFIILCEGTKTEPFYLKAIKDSYQLLNVKLVKSKAHDLEAMLSVIENDPEKQFDGYDHIWCVVDDDAKPQNQRMIPEFKRKNINVAYSNPCIELWFLLHVYYTTGFMNSQEAFEKFKGCYSDYTKSWTLFSMIIPRTDEAIKNAKALRSHHESCGNDEYSCPSTTVDRLVSALIKSSA